MGKKDDDDSTEESDDSKGGGKLKLIIGAVVLVVVGAVLGGKVLGGGGATAASATGPTTTTTAPPGVLHSVDSITLNLADGRFLKLGLAFEVRHDAEYPMETDVADEATKGFAREIDAVITTMGSYTFEELHGPNGKINAKRKLLEEVQRISDDAIEDVLFYEFVMQ